ncbi:hypothetical protein JCM19232_5889 [Vibrio ishigakensis]|uniref:Uncharacterized protein n=1 Tax=Vibrio ishigakensis TaxID=1481914 RepID=A0A0B8PEP4_9VIBR|nr:hypothetical protein JCM19232_5889 [Vibrio ishigakensis]
MFVCLDSSLPKNLALGEQSLLHFQNRTRTSKGLLSVGMAMLSPGVSVTC